MNGVFSHLCIDKNRNIFASKILRSDFKRETFTYTILVINQVGLFKPDSDANEIRIIQKSDEFFAPLLFLSCGF